MQAIKKLGVIRAAYLYLVTVISIVIIIISLIGFIKIVLEEYVFEVKGWEEMDSYNFTATNDYPECTDDALLYSYDDKGKQVLKKKYSTMSEEQLAAEKIACNENAKNNRQMQHINNVKRDLVMSISMLLVALPIYFYHWGVIKREGKK